MNNNSIILIGGGGHCKSIVDSLGSLGEYDDVIITDPNLAIGSTVLGCKVVGNDEDLKRLYFEGYKNACISVGSIRDTSVRRKIYKKTQPLGFSFPTIIDCSASISESISLGDGVYVGKNAVINCCCEINDFAIINSGAIIEHDCIIGQFTHVSVGAVVCGGCRIGKDVLVGANATVIQEVNVGDNSIIGAGSIVLTDVPPNSVVVGVWGRRQFVEP